MEFKADGDMSLKEYWGKHYTFIAKDRHWAIQEGDQYRFETCATLRQYDGKSPTAWTCQSPKSHWLALRVQCQR